MVNPGPYDGFPLRSQNPFLGIGVAIFVNLAPIRANYFVPLRNILENLAVTSLRGATSHTANSGWCRLEVAGSEHKLSGLNGWVDQKCNLTAGFRAESRGSGVRSKLEVRGGMGRAGLTAGEFRGANIPVEKEGRAKDFCEYRYSLRKASGRIRYARLVVPAEYGASGRDSVNICPESGLRYRCECQSGAPNFSNKLGSDCGLAFQKKI